MKVRFRVLGPVGVMVDGEDATPSGRLPRLLLGALLAHDPGLSSDELCRLLWGEPGLDARLHLLVHRTRALLDEPDRLERTPDGYRLRLELGERDLDELEHLAAHDPRGALATLKSEPFGGCEGELFDTVRAGLAERIALARKSALRAAFDAGDDDLVLAEAPAARDAAPYDEELAVLHLGSLARTGRTAEALEGYESLRRSLADELGIDPGPELRELHLRLISGGGAAPAPVPRQLPPHVEELVGRDAEQSRLDRLHDGAPRIAAVTGTAGVGKTALVLAWASRSHARFPDGMLYVDLGGFSDGPPIPPAAALEGFLRALGQAVTARGLNEMSAAFRTATSGRRLLVILDNARNAAHVRPLLPAAQGPTTVVTSREALAGLGVYAPVLDVPVAPLDEAAATTLVRAELGDLDTSTAALLAAGCARLPLAIKVAGRAVGGPDAAVDAAVEPLLIELAERRRGLELLETDDDASDLRSVLSWSLDALEPEARHVFRMFGLVGAPMTPEAIAALVGGDPAETVRHLRRLRRAHLVAAADETRITMHDLLRQLAVRLTAQECAPAEGAAARSRLLAHYEAGADAAIALLSPSIEPVNLPDLDDRPSTDRPVLPDGALPKPLASAHDAARWLQQEWRAIADLADVADPDLDERVVSLVIRLRGYVVSQGHFAAAEALFEQLRLRAARRGDRYAESSGIRLLGTLATLRAEVDAGRRRLDQARRLSHELGDLAGVAAAANNLGEIARLRGDHDESVARFEEALRINQRLGDSPRVGINAGNLALAFSDRGDFELAAARANEALRIAEQTGRVRVRVLGLRALASAQLGLGHVAVAARTLRDAEQAAGPLADVEVHAMLRIVDAKIRAAAGDAAQALALLDQVVGIGRDLGLSWQVHEALRETARLHERLGEPAAADRAHAEAEAAISGGRDDHGA